MDESQYLRYACDHIMSGDLLGKKWINFVDSIIRWCDTGNSTPAGPLS